MDGWMDACLRMVPIQAYESTCTHITQSGSGKEEEEAKPNDGGGEEKKGGKGVGGGGNKAGGGSSALALEAAGVMYIKVWE